MDLDAYILINTLGDYVQEICGEPPQDCEVYVL